MNILKSLFSRKTPEDTGVAENIQPPPSEDCQEYAPPDSVKDKHTNLVYQDYGGGKGGSDSASKLAVIKLPELSGKRFLDLGCNAGYFCAYAADHGASYVLGIDNSDKVIGIARERHPSLDFRGGGWDEYPDGDFDVVICLSAIHYAKDAVALARNVRNSLSRDGVFVLEGGLIGAADDFWTDMLIPVWREVGDKCRHLSLGFVQRHLFMDYDWEVMSESITQGGDPINRFVIHARPKANAAFGERPAHRLCPLEYASALALSAPTIHDQQVSSQYVRALAAGAIDSDRLGAVLGDGEAYALFIEDIVYALNNHRESLELKASAGEAFTAKLAASLEANGVSVTRV